MRIISGIARGTKLYTLDGNNTRPTLDRIKEPLFSIIQNNIKDAIVLDLFSGSGALGLEALSRGAKKAILCDKSYEAMDVIKRNIDKTHFEEKTEVFYGDYKKCLDKLNEKIDLIFIDPPYKLNIAVKAVDIILKKDKTSPYINDLNEVISLLEKMKKCIDSNGNVQKFNAIASSIIDHADYMAEKYASSPERYYISFVKLQNIAAEVRNLATLRCESQVYIKYLAYQHDNKMLII